MPEQSPVHRIPRRFRPGRPLSLLLLSVGLMACGQQTPSQTFAAPDTAQLEAENGTISPLAAETVGNPRSGGRVIQDPNARGGRAVILLGTNDNVRFVVPASLKPGRYTVSVRGRGENYQGWPTVDLNDARQRRLAVATLDSATYVTRTFGEFDLKPGQVLNLSFINDLDAGRDQDRNAVVDYLLIEPAQVTPAPQPPDAPYAVQFGSRDTDVGNSVAVDAGGNAYVAGGTYGTLLGQVGVGDQDAFVRKTNAQGQEVWTRQFETANRSYAYAVAVDAAGNSYVGGLAEGAFPGQTHLGYTDAFLRKYSADGTALWTRQFGTPQEDSVYGVTVDAAGNVYAVGTLGAPHLGAGGVPDPWEASSTADVFVRKYAPDGTEVWTRQFSTPQEDFSGSVTVDAAGNVLIAGRTGDEAFVSKYTASGEPVRTWQFGSVVDNTNGPSKPYAAASSVRVDPVGNIYVGGTVAGALPGQTSVGLTDAFVRKYSADGQELWTEQVGNGAVDGQGFKTVKTSGALDLDPAGNVYLALNSSTNLEFDLPTLEAVLKYGPDGTLLQTLPVGRKGASFNRMAVGSSGSVFLTGRIDGTLPGATSAGGGDVFLIKLVP